MDSLLALFGGKQKMATKSGLYDTILKINQCYTDKNFRNIFGSN
jgi:hypothetical protein